MKNFIHRRGFRNHQPREYKLMKALIRKATTSLIAGWGKRQLLKLGLAIAPVLAVTNDQIESTVAVIIAGALMLIEVIFSKINSNRLKK